MPSAAALPGSPRRRSARSWSMSLASIEKIRWRPRRETADRPAQFLEIRPERRARCLSKANNPNSSIGRTRPDFVRNGVGPNPLARRDLVTNIMQALLQPTTPEGRGGGGGGLPAAPRRYRGGQGADPAARPRTHGRRRAAAEMPRPAFEAQLTGWVKAQLAETKIQLNFVEQRELVGR